MSEKILVPVLGESITEATVSKWLKNKGISLKLLSDKSTLWEEIPRITLDDI